MHEESSREGVAVDEQVAQSARPIAGVVAGAREHEVVVNSD